MGVGAATEAMGDTGENAVPAGGGRSQHERGAGGLGEGFGGGGIGGVAGLGKAGARDAEEPGGPAGGELVGGGLDARADQADDELGTGERGAEVAGGAEGFQRGWCLGG
jgi:hypothetical protein